MCPFEAGAFRWEAQPGQSSLTVVVKGTFALAPGDLPVASAQDPLAEERHHEDRAVASLYWPGDFAPVKRKVDVTLVGHAYAPGGRPADTLLARLAVGDFTKAVRVSGDRVWTRDNSLQLVPSAPAPFVRMPLRYERAALGSDNPVGFDRGASPATGQLALPNLEHGGGAGLPCFGPISTEWRSRRRLLDEASMFWAYGVARAPREGAPPIGPAPPRFDFAFFNAAPLDQQIDLLRPGAPLVLEHLHPAHPRLEARLPAMRPQVFRIPPPSAGKGRVEEIILRADSLWIDTDRAVLVITWRGLADAAGDVGTLVVDADPEGKKLRWDRVEKRFAEVRPPTLRLPADGVTPPSARRAPAPAGPDPLAIRYDGVSRMRPPEPVPMQSATLTEALGPSGPPPARPASQPPESMRDEPTNPLEPPTLQRPGPLADLTRKDAPRPAPQPLPKMPPPPVADRPARPPRPTAWPALRKDLGIERYGAICAELAIRSDSRAAVLKANLLSEAAWTLVDQHWRRALAQEAEEGGQALKLAFDEAYLATQQRLRQP